MKKTIIFLALAFLPLVASAQSPLNAPAINDMGNVNYAESFRYKVKAIHDIRSIDDIKEHYDGSVLLFEEEWVPALVTMKNGKEENMMMNYFIYDNSLIYLKGRDSVMTVAMTDRIKDVKIGDRVFELVTYTEGNASSVKSGVFEVVYKGEPMSLVKKHEMELKPGQDASGYKEATKPSIVTSSVLYYQPINTTFSKPVPMKKKEFYSIFGEHSNEVKDYAKKNRLKINENGVAKMVEYYNSL